MLKIDTMSSAKSAVFVALLACACGGEPPSSSQATAKPAGTAGSQPAATHFAGSYDVPVEPALSAAAHFPLTDLKWTVDGASARLVYDLPRELVGKSLSVDFSGNIASDNSAQLSGEAGTADCTIDATSVVCHENLAGLLPLEPDLGVVEALAATTYAGNAADRLDVARLFSGDPIGIAEFDASTAGNGEHD